VIPLAPRAISECFRDKELIYKALYEFICFYFFKSAVSSFSTIVVICVCLFFLADVPA